MNSRAKLSKESFYDTLTLSSEVPRVQIPAVENIFYSRKLKMDRTDQIIEALKRQDWTPKNDRYCSKAPSFQVLETSLHAFSHNISFQCFYGFLSRSQFLWTIFTRNLNIKNLLHRGCNVTHHQCDQIWRYFAT